MGFLERHVRDRKHFSGRKRASKASALQRTEKAVGKGFAFFDK